VAFLRLVPFPRGTLFVRPTFSPSEASISPSTVMQIIVSMKDVTPPTSAAPSAMSALCWRRRHRCHGCRVVAAIATVAIAAATSAAAAVRRPIAMASTAAATAPQDDPIGRLENSGSHSSLEKVCRPSEGAVP
jgi:hypothetical protein